MDSCIAVERELEKVLSKFGSIKDYTDKTLGDLIEYVCNLQRELNEVPNENEIVATQALIMGQCIKKVKDTVARIASEHRDVHSAVSKVGKSIDRNFTADFGTTSAEEVFEGSDKAQLLNQVICEHFYRQGMLDIGEELVKEAKLTIDEHKKEPFFELNRILDGLKHHDLQPALKWAQENRQNLMQQNSKLEFNLHRLMFIELISQGVDKQEEIIHYARQNFPLFAGQHESDIQALMGSLLYIRQGIADSPYNYLLDPIHWLDICDLFTRDACALLGLSVDSPLSAQSINFVFVDSINAGCTALPALLNIKQVMLQRQVTGVWSSRDELPIEIDLGREYRYHSVFACPILRQQSTESNPPMRLMCGHVISRDALNKLASGNKYARNMLKCPYCPVEQTPAEARLIHF
uniref:RING-Gid-type domain-containing protein n=1 Tax=Strigamia maritima TaxID=126957 RepID=T1IIW7_STRMM